MRVQFVLFTCHNLSTNVYFFFSLCNSSTYLGTYMRLEMASTYKITRVYNQFRSAQVQYAYEWHGIHKNLELCILIDINI